MDRIIYTSMTGANAAAQRQAVLANNLANASTTGFRAELSTFRSVPLQGSGAGTRVFALDATSGYLATPGAAQTTGRSLDAMAMGNAWFAVQGLDGTETYTRAGHFQISEAGQLVTPNGQLVLSDGGAPIDIPPNVSVVLGALAELGYDGPVTPKPSRGIFPSRRRDLVVKQTGEALDRLWRAAGLPATERRTAVGSASSSDYEM